MCIYRYIRDSEAVEVHHGRARDERGQVRHYSFRLQKHHFNHTLIDLLRLFMKQVSYFKCICYASCNISNTIIIDIEDTPMSWGTRGGGGSG